MTHGIILIDKPQGLTSNAVLQKVKRALGVKKAGHTGSLDPLATGMLPICVGEGTKVCQYLLEADKCYEVVGRLGITTTTGDVQGEVVSTYPDFTISKTNFMNTLDEFRGEIQQMPPMYSALKHQGRPLYDYARKGQTIERSLRTVTIFDLTCLDYSKETFTLRVTCSKGTYIRSLVEAIGERLGVGAHVQALRRLYTAGFEQNAMIPLADFLELTIEERLNYLLPITRGLQSFRSHTLTDQQVKTLRYGQIIPDFSTPALHPERIQLINEFHHFIGIGQIQPDGSLISLRLISEHVDQSTIL